MSMRIEEATVQLAKAAEKPEKYEAGKKG